MKVSFGILGVCAFVGGCTCYGSPYVYDSGTVPTENCLNAVDDDGDGDIDCADLECETNPACVTGGEICGNGIDDEGDALADCADDDCFGMGTCVDPCIMDPTLPGCSDPDPGAKFGVGGNVGGFHMKTPPACDPASTFYILPPPSFMGSNTVVTGGSGLFSGMVAGGTLTKIVVSFVELTGYYEVPLSGSSFTFTVSFAQSLTLSMVTMVLIPYGLDGAVGQCFMFPINIVQVGGGDLQISLVFDQPDDVDLHVVEPGGFEIYYGATVSPSGGNLDLDSNPACFQDYVNNENVTYMGVTPPTGMYTVRVDYWEDCNLSSGPVNYVVTVTKGGIATTYMGMFANGSDDGGGAGSGVTVATFMYP